MSLVSTKYRVQILKDLRDTKKKTTKRTTETESKNTETQGEIESDTSPLTPTL